jgi:hypothetical protein
MAMKLNADSPIVQLGSAAVGFILGDKINVMVDKVTGTMDGKLVGGIEAGLGAALVFMKLTPGKKSLLQVVPGGLLAGAGIKKLLQEFGVINGIGGYGAVPVIGKRIVNGALNGYGSVPVVAGYTPNQALNGIGGYQVPPNPYKSSNVMGSLGSDLLSTSHME